MGSAGMGSLFVDNRGEFSSASGAPRPKRVRQWVATAAVALFSSAFLSSCSGFFIKPTISSIYITPAAATVGVGQSTPLTASAIYSDGTQNQLSGDSVGWSSSATNIATVTSPGGSVTGVGLGTATITATAQSSTGTASVNVTISNITSLVITTKQGSTQPITTATIAGTNGSLQFYAYANGSANNDVTQAVTWSSSNSSTVASISSGNSSGNGLASAVAAGTTNITATATNTTTGQQVTSQTVVLTVTQ